MPHFLGFFLVLLNTSIHAVILPDGTRPGMYDNPPVTQLIVKLSDSQHPDIASAEQRATQAVRNATGLETKLIRQMSTGATILALPEPMNQQQVEEYARWIMQQEGVEYAEPNARRWPMRVPNDEHYTGLQWHLKAPEEGDASAANLPEAWDITTGSSDIVVAVVDTGALNHIDMDTRFVGGSAAVSGRDFISDAGTARDTDGRDSNPTDEGDWSDGTNCTEGDSSWHGTHVAGIIGVETNNALDTAGIDWNARLLTVRTLGECGGSLADVYDGVQWAAGLTVDGVANPNPARVINLSLGEAGSCSFTEQEAINDAVNLGAVMVVAAGNENTDVANVSPASCNNVITVAALNQDGSRASFSNFGEEVDIAAPGVDIWSAGNSGTTTAVPEDGDPSNIIGDFSVNYSGTSMATPQVSGVVALMLAANQAAGGNLLADARKAETSPRIKTKLQASARAFPTGTDCTTSTCGAGMLDAHQAVVAVSTIPAVNAGNDQPVLSGANVTLSASATDDNYNTTTTWQWMQTAGTSVILTNATSATASFIAPTTNETLTFSVTATDDTGLTDTDSVDIQVSDTEPNAFNFTDQTNVALNSTVTSNTITVSGINMATGISVSGGEYSINGGSYTASAGTVSNGDTITVRHTSSASFSTQIDTTLTIGGVSDTFSSTTLAVDSTPNAFSFTDQTNVALNSTVTSNTITVSGINTSVAISVSGGEYNINGGSYTASAGTVSNGDTVTVRHTSSASFSTQVDTVLTMGGVSGTFSSTTLAENTGGGGGGGGGGGSISIYGLLILSLLVGLGRRWHLV